MQKVRIDKEKLLRAVEDNRKGHRATFEAALEEYRSAVTKFLNEQIERVKAGVLIEHYIRLPQPEDHTGQYDQVIQMLEFSEDDTIELTSQEFAQYVMDNWAWTGKFREDVTSLSTYNSTGALPISA